MNSIVSGQFELLDAMHNLRDGVLNELSSEDLKFHVENNPTFGELFAQAANVERAYTQSFRTFHMDWSLLGTPPTVDIYDPATLKAWFKQLDADLKAALEALSEDDVQTKTIDRGEFTPMIFQQFHIYREALLIIYGRLSIYMTALNKPPTQMWKEWVG
ncbi:MAG: hypothetical protein K8L99_14850 [Anaerolineae bacterium]|nr:hypothetical protein [Anaerolineae bacterium]